MVRIPVVISSDDKIFFTVGVVLISLLENAKSDTFYEINIFCSNVSEENKNNLLKLKDIYQNMSISFFDMGDKFKNLSVTKGYHVNYVSAYKMLIPSMFPQFDKLIYLDTDILVRGDLQEMYNFNIGDNYIASTPVLTNVSANYLHLTNSLDIPDMDYYVNAGVMLMNLKKIREDKIDEIWISLLGSFEGSVDQHILNKVCYGKTIYMPLKFNTCLSEMYIYKSDFVYCFYSPKEVKEAIEEPVIFHWTGNMKPWKYSNVFLAQEWLRYYLKSPCKTELKRTVYAKKRTFFSNILYVTKNFKDIIRNIRKGKNNGSN